jgi:hypothetical protein
LRDPRAHDVRGDHGHVLRRDVPGFERLEVGAVGDFLDLRDLGVAAAVSPRFTDAIPRA